MTPITRQALKSPRTVDMKDIRGANRDLQAQKRLEGRFAIQMLGRMANVPEVSDSIQKGMRADYWFNIAKRKMRRMVGLYPAGPTESSKSRDNIPKARPEISKARPAKSKARPAKGNASPAKSKARPAKSKARPAKSKARNAKSKARPAKSKRFFIVEEVLVKTARSGKNKGKETVHKKQKAPKSLLYTLGRGGELIPFLCSDCWTDSR